MQQVGEQRSSTINDPDMRIDRVAGRILRDPFAALVEGFNWKTAAMSAMLRAAMFFLTNLRAGQQRALKATLVEACYAICAMGVFGAITERIRKARPAWLTGLIVWICLPAAMLTIQFLVHRAMGTPELRRSMIASFCFAALGTGFSWFAMRRGAMIVGRERRSFAADLRELPAIVWAFITAIPRALVGLVHGRMDRDSVPVTSRRTSL